jgi:hypothetical protein
MVKVSYLGGLGNNLWQYTAGRILAEKLGSAFDAPPIPDIPNLETKLNGKRHWLRRLTIQGHFIPDDCHGKLVKIKSGLERYENIAGRQRDIKRWIEIPKKSLYAISKQDLVISIRRGWNNYPVEENCPTFEYYYELLAKFNYSKLFICTDSPEDKFFENFRDNFKNLEIVKGDRIIQLNVLLSAERLIMAPSTFSFWGGYLGSASAIYWPRIESLNFTGKNHDWFPYDDHRHIWVD